MTPMIISALVFGGVTALVGVLAFVFREQGPQTATRLDLLVGKRSRQDQQQERHEEGGCADEDVRPSLQDDYPMRHVVS